MVATFDGVQPEATKQDKRKWVHQLCQEEKKTFSLPSQAFILNITEESYNMSTAFALYLKKYRFRYIYDVVR